MMRWLRAPNANLLLVGVLLLAWYRVGDALFVGWNVPSDAGVIAQSAERVLSGELPHRDFDELWSGGLDWLNAGAFWLFGIKLASLRILVFVAWMLGLVAMFDSSRQFLTPWGAAALTWGGSLWSLPLSSDPLPSWYNLFLALMGGAAVLRAIRGNSRRWMFMAGLAAGASIAIKIVGLYFVAAVLMFSVFEAQARTPAPLAVRPQSARIYGWLITIGLSVFLGEVVALIAFAPTINNLVQFVLPSGAMVAVLIKREWYSDGSTDLARARALFTLVAPFLAGTALVVAIWLVPYAASHSIPALLHGVFVVPQLRFRLVTFPMPGLTSAFLAVLPFALLVSLAPFVRKPLRRADLWIVGASAALFIYFCYDGSPVVLVAWYAFRTLTPCVAVMGFWWLLYPPAGAPISEGQRSVVFFLLCSAAVCSLVQVPMSYIYYFYYFVPLLMLGAAALWTSFPRMPRAVPIALIATAIAFQLRSPSTLATPSSTRPSDELALLSVARGGISVRREDSTRYARLYEEVHKRATSDWLYVWHDAPEIYFLTGMRNPTRTLFEAFADPATLTTEAVQQVLREKNISVVVLTRPDIAPIPMPRELRRWIDAQYPSVAWVGDIEVRGRAIVR